MLATSIRDKGIVILASNQPQLSVNNIDLTNAVEEMQTFMSTTASGSTGGNQAQLTVSLVPSQASQLQTTLSEIQSQSQHFPIQWVTSGGQSYSGQGQISSVNSQEGEVIFKVTQLKQG